MGEPVPAARYVNARLGAWTVAAPWLLGGANAGSTVNAAVVGVALVALSLPRGPVRERYGGWSPYVV